MTRRDEIIKQAGLLFSLKGYSAVSMRDIAKSLDIKAASLYNHLPSKQAILEAIVLNLANTFVNHIHDVNQNPSFSTRQKLSEIIQQHIDLSLHQPESVAVLNTEWIHLNGEALDKFKAKRFRYEQELREIIKYGIQEQSITKRDPEVILFSILSTLRTLNLWVAKRKHLTVEDLKADLETILLYGIIRQSDS
ncbi:TetR/AcrR family transcriptional regulator [Psychroflexus sp. ALD_RP9]|uniref:TetR/AcrR family transcriptional regulator n=1 Tax=Psychroflexus sp. ALD_RP9 TaxID=2777186 RepID=UPI001A8C57E9|nr:TetR/AcrR family transcriptional regulator [Psychroflexus sp. ALD_RP9]QSS97670.1 TetR/AcrR family transcriptional regulator [Psychroflexus sp. ALD_RP9]